MIITAKLDMIFFTVRGLSVISNIEASADQMILLQMAEDISGEMTTLWVHFST